MYNLFLNDLDNPLPFLLAELVELVELVNI